MSCSVCAGYDSSKCPVCGEGVETRICPDCEGSGYTPYKAYDILAKKEIPITELAWQILPDDEDEADDKGMRFCKVEIEICPRCSGEGSIPIGY